MGHRRVPLTPSHQQKGNFMTERHPVIFVGAGPGDPELITVKGQKALAAADLVLYAGSLVSPAILTWAGPGAELIDTAPLNLEEIVGRMMAGYRAGNGWSGSTPATPPYMGPSRSSWKSWNGKRFPAR